MNLPHPDLCSHPHSPAQTVRARSQIRSLTPKFITSDRRGLNRSLRGPKKKVPVNWSGVSLPVTYTVCHQALGLSSNVLVNHFLQIMMYGSVNPACRPDGCAGTCLFMGQIFRKCPLSISVIRLLITLHSPPINQRLWGGAVAG